MSDSMATVMVVVLTGNEEHVRRASMEVQDAVAQARTDDVGALVRNFDVSFDKEEKT